MKKLSIRTLICLGYGFFMALTWGSTAAGQTSPQPLEKLDRVFDLTSLSSFDMRSMKKCEDLGETLKTLKEAHRSNFEKAKLIHASAWANFIQKDEPSGTVTLVEFSADVLQGKSLEIHKYPKEKFLGDLSSISTADENFDVLIGNIKTTGVELNATGYLRKGLSSVEIDHPKSGTSKTRFHFEQTFVPAATSMDHFCSSLQFFQESERYRVGAWQDEHNLYLKVRFRDKGEDKARTWKFDLRHGGCVEFQDLMVGSSCSLISVEYEVVNGAYMPSFYRRDEFDRNDGRWGKRVEYTYFGYRFEETSDSAFSVHKLPIDGEVNVRDSRSGRSQTRKFKELVDEKR